MAWWGRKARARWQKSYLRVINDPRILGHWHEHERSLLSRFLQVLFARGWLEKGSPSAPAGEARSELSQIWPFGRGCERVFRSDDLDAAYLAVGLMWNRLFASRVLVTERMMAEIADLWRFTMVPEARDKRVLKWFGPYKDGRPMTYDAVETLWELIEKDIRAWPENHHYGRSLGQVDGEEAPSAHAQMAKEYDLRVYEWHSQLLPKPGQPDFAAMDPSFGMDVEPITDQELIEALGLPGASAAVNAAAVKVMTAATEYDTVVRHRYAFPLEWLQAHRDPPAFLEKLLPPAGFELFDDGDRDRYRRFELSVLPALRRLYGVKEATPYDAARIWPQERDRYILKHPHGYVYLEQPDVPSVDRDVHLFFLAVLHDEAVGGGRVLIPEVRVVNPGFYGAVAACCASLCKRVPQRFRAFLAELSQELQIREPPADNESSSETVKEEPSRDQPPGDSAASIRANGAPPPSRMRAAQSLYFALLRERSLIPKPLNDIHRWLRDNQEDEENPYHGQRLPRERSWKGYVREACDHVRVRDLAAKEWAFADSRGSSVVDISRIDYSQIHRIGPESA